MHKLGWKVSKLGDGDLGSRRSRWADFRRPGTVTTPTRTRMTLMHVIGP